MALRSLRRCVAQAAQRQPRSLASAMALSHLLSAVARARSVPSKGWKVLSSKQYKRLYKGA